MACKRKVALVCESACIESSACELASSSTGWHIGFCFAWRCPLQLGREVFKFLAEQPHCLITGIKLAIFTCGWHTTDASHQHLAQQAWTWPTHLSMKCTTNESCCRSPCRASPMANLAQHCAFEATAAFGLLAGVSLCDFRTPPGGSSMSISRPKSKRNLPAKQSGCLGRAELRRLL